MSLFRRFLISIALLLFIFTQNALGEKVYHLRLMLDWFINPSHAPLIVAKQQGFFKKHNLDVQFVTPSDPSDPIKLVAAQQVDMALTYEPNFLFQEMNLHLPIIQVGTLIATPLDCLMVLKNSPIQKISDLKGKRIGTSSSGTKNMMLSILLRKVGLTLNNVTIVNVHYGLVQALLAKKVDAISGAFRNFEPFEVEQAGQTARLFFPEEYGMPLYSELIFITTKKNRNNEAIQLFLKSIREGVIYLINHPEESWENAIKNYPELNNAVNKKSWFASLSRFALRPEIPDKEQNETLKAFINQ